MKRGKIYYTVCVLILSLLWQNTAVASNKQKMNNTAPVANFTVEKSRNVKIIVLTDYTGADNANLKNSLSSMKSQLANYSKIDIEYTDPTDITIGTQQGKITQNTWAKNGYATYRWTGYTFNQKKYTEYYNQATTDKFVYSKYITLPEGQTPDEPYGVPVSYTKSTLQSQPYQFGTRQYYIYTFLNNNGLCDGVFNIDREYHFYYPTDTQELFKDFTEPTFRYDDFWSIQSSNIIDSNNTVIGWDLSKLNYEVKDSVDTYVVFALNNSDTNYYSPHIASNYRLGLLRNDSTLGKYVKDTDARVYSICSDSLENTNLSVNLQYPITFNQSGQNISLRDLINSSFDGRSVGEKNVPGLVNKIRENIRRPSGNIDMVVASDNDIAGTNSFVESIRDKISSDVDLKASVIDNSFLEDIDTWTQYVTKGDFKSITTYNTDATLILTGNGELWARGSNLIGYVNDKNVYGLFGLSTTVTYYDSFVKIATNVKEVYMHYYMGNVIYIIKNDGSLWTCGTHCLKYDEKKGGYQPNILTTFTQVSQFSDVRSLSFGVLDIWDMYVVTGNGVFQTGLSNDWNIIPPIKEPYAPANVQYVYGGGDYFSSALYYVSMDGTIDCTYISRGERDRKLVRIGKFPTPIKSLSNTKELRALVFLCEDNKIYNYLGQCVLNTPVKQAVLDQTQYGVSYVLTNDGKVYDNSSYYWSTNNNTGIDKILYVENKNGGLYGIVVRTTSGEIGYIGRVHYENIFKTDITSTIDPNYYYASNGSGYISLFDASIGGTAADYLQIGNRFCYVTKQGYIYYIECESLGRDEYGYYRYSYETVNCGNLNSIFDISYKPVKAFSKSKILNTQLREGSERYFIYISDNIEQDTYFGSPSNYFLFGNLDYDILNYLNANKFNIYVVTPEQARNIKLRYPNVPVDRQQYSLSDLIYNSNMDSAFCRDTDTVRKLIVKRYDTYTKQGTTTLTLLVNEESVRYNQVYRDFENDPKHSEKWQYTHDPTYFDNSNGLDSNSGKWITEPLYTFNKVGKYVVSAQFRDNPREDNRFDKFRLWSNVSAPATILVHRRPIALFNVQVGSKIGTNVSLSYLDQSYDLDHNKTRTDKGIAARYWQYKNSSSDMWLDGKPSNLTYNSGIYQIKLVVKDIEGVWSKPYIDSIDTSNLPPTINATPLTYTGAGPLNITLTASDNGEDDFAYMRYAITDSSELPASSQWIKVEEGIKERSIALNADGSYYLHMEAYDKLGQTGKNFAGPYIINNVKAGNFFITMMLDIGWRAYYFDLERGIDDNHDGMLDRYLRRPNTDIGTLKMPINYYNLVSSPRTYIKAGYRVKGRIDIQGNPDSARFKINYRVKETEYTDTASLVKGSGDTYTFEWIIPLDTDDKSFISFDLEMMKGSITYGNEKWNDVWDTRNPSRYVFYVCGKATDDLIYIQSQ